MRASCVEISAAFVRGYNGIDVLEGNPVLIEMLLVIGAFRVMVPLDPASIFAVDE